MASPPCYNFYMLRKALEKAHGWQTRFSFGSTSAIIASIVFGLLLLAVVSYLIAKNGTANPYASIMTHLLMAVVIIIISNFAGDFLVSRFTQ